MNVMVNTDRLFTSGLYNICKLIILIPYSSKFECTVHDIALLLKFHWLERFTVFLNNLVLWYKAL